MLRIPPSLSFLGIFLWVAGFQHTQAVQIRVATMNVLNGIEGSGTSGRVALEAVVGRIDADILGLQEVLSRDFQPGNSSNLNDFSQNLGYPHVYIPMRALDTQSRTVVFSKFPIIVEETKSIISPPGANDMTRAISAVTIDVPGTINDPVILNAHLKCCFDPDDPFRRAVEMERVKIFLAENQLDGAEDNIFFMGDLNLLGSDQVFQTEPEGLPISYRLGNDITFPVRYFSDPVDYLKEFNITNPGYRQQDGLETSTFMGSTTVLDFLLVSKSIAERTPATEIYNSELESSHPGVPKNGSPLSSSTSERASDHYPVFGDFELDHGSPLQLTASSNTIVEGGSSTTLTVVLPEAPTTKIQVQIQADLPSEVQLDTNQLFFEIGQTLATTTVSSPLDGINDGLQTVKLRASGGGYQGAEIEIQIEDQDPTEYVIGNAFIPVTENFDLFAGTQKPAAWRANQNRWLGDDDGSSSKAGGRSYRATGQTGGSLGILTDEQTSYVTTVRNASKGSIDSLGISYSAQQWRSTFGGPRDRWEVQLIRDGERTLLNELSFSSNNSGHTEPTSTNLSTELTNFLLRPNEEFELEFTLIPGSSGGALSEGIFINEIHYDNSGIDEGEFVEIVVGASFPDELDEVSLWLYNGSNGSNYGSAHPLQTFIKGPDQGPGFPRIFHKNIPGLQNGAADGLALVIDGEVEQFISYEGTLAAIEGPASGLSSIDVGVSQATNGPPGVMSIGLVGNGASEVDFQWQRLEGEHSPGLANEGQRFGTPVRPQGLAIDDLIINPLQIVGDQDGDFLTDAEEAQLGTDPTNPDTDQDGQSDYFEAVLALTDPLSAGSIFAPEIETNSENVTLTVSTKVDRQYTLEVSTDLKNWDEVEIFNGSGSEIVRVFPFKKSEFYRVRIAKP